MIASLSSILINSKKKAEDEAEWELQERCKSHCIWLTGQKGLTEYDAAVLIIQEAKELLASDLLQMGVDWKPAGTVYYHRVFAFFVNCLKMTLRVFCMSNIIINPNIKTC